MKIMDSKLFKTLRRVKDNTEAARAAKKLLKFLYRNAE